MDLVKEAASFFMGFPRAGFVMVAKSPMVEGNAPGESMDALLEAEVICSWLRKRRHPKMRWSFKESKVVRNSAMAGVAYGGTGGRLVGSRCKALRSRGGRFSFVEAMSSLSDSLKVSVDSVAGSSIGWCSGMGEGGR